MHEVSLVRSLLDQAEAICRREGGARVAAIRVEIGPLSGVEPLLVRSALARLVAERGLAPVELVIDEAPLSALCRQCGLSFVVERFHFACPSCRGGQVQVVRGDKFCLISVTLRDDAAVESVS